MFFLLPNPSFLLALVDTHKVWRIEKTIALMIAATHESDRRPRTGYLVLKLAATVLPGGVIVKAYWFVSLIALS